MSVVLNGKELSERILENAKNEISKLNFTPKLVVISVGNDPASLVYIRNKKRACERVGIDFEEIHINPNEIVPPETITGVLVTKIINLSYDNTITGILVQKPIEGLSKHEEELIDNLINKNKDVDVFNKANLMGLLEGNDDLLPCTPKGILSLLEEYNIQVEGKHAVIIGRSNIVGKPLALALLNKNATVTICHSKTKNIAEITKTADILISAVGKRNMVTADMVKAGAVVIDVGMNRNEEGKLVGDVDFENVKEKSSYITPVPGGVGAMTVASLIQNIIQLAKK